MGTEWEYALIGMPIDMPPQTLEEVNSVIISGAIVNGARPTMQYLSQMVAGGIDALPNAEPVSHDIVRIGSTLVLTILVRHRKSPV